MVDDFIPRPSVWGRPFGDWIAVVLPLSDGMVLELQSRNGELSFRYVPVSHPLTLGYLAGGFMRLA